VLATLQPGHREVLLLVGYEGLTPTEAAAVCGITPEALRQRLARARAALAERLDLPSARLALRRSYGT
jgi:RNA polymerase sigma-70 factor (ECF subfamily)